MALKLVIHPSATGTALEYDGTSGIIQRNGEKFCCVWPQIIPDVCFITDHVAHASSKKTKIV